MNFIVFWRRPIWRKKLVNTNGNADNVINVYEFEGIVLRGAKTLNSMVSYEESFLHEMIFYVQLVYT